MRVLAGPSASYLKPDDVPGQHVVGLLVLKGPDMVASQSNSSDEGEFTEAEHHEMARVAEGGCRRLNAECVVLIVVRNGLPDVKCCAFAKGDEQQRKDFQAKVEAILDGVNRVVSQHCDSLLLQRTVEVKKKDGAVVESRVERATTEGIIAPSNN